MPRRVVVTGVGVIAPNGIGSERFWANTLAGRSGVRAIDSFDTNGFKSTIAGQVNGFDPRDHGCGERQVRRLDRYAQFAVAGAAMALEDAALAANGSRAGVLIANAICGTRRMEQEFITLSERGVGRLDPRWACRALYQHSTFNTASAEVASTYGFRGPCLTMSTGCTAGLDAIGTAADLVAAGDADVMIAGAAEAPVTPIALAAFDVIGALSTARNGAPERASRPFDAGRDGFVLAEGCGILVLEELGHAERRGAAPLAEVRGFASCSNAFHMTDLPPDGVDLARAIDGALDRAGIPADAVDHISAHGSSTQQNDVNETAALKRVLGERAYEVTVTGLKSMTGHPLAAANSIESVAAVLTIAEGALPPTINYDEPDPACDLDYVPNASVHRGVDVVVKVASGFSGIHSAAVFARPES